MSAEQNKQIVLDVLKNISTGNISKALASMADDGDWWVAGSLPVSGSNTKAEMLKLLGGIATVFKGPFVIEPQAITAEGGRVAVEAISRADHTNGKTYRNEYHFLFVLKDGKIQQVKEYMDTMHANEVLFTA
jgi:uncharacterized protein